jgi:DNA-binding response OmpR family regulator
MQATFCSALRISVTDHGNAAKISAHSLQNASMRILIVEDEYVTALALRTELREAGHEVVGVATGEREAVECFRHQRPDLAIVDIHLSQGNGVSAVKKLGSIPVLFVTPDSKALADLSRAASAVLLKPFGPEKIVEAVRAVAEVAAGKERPTNTPPRFRFLV